MDRYRLKNVIIIILVLVNVFLFAALMMWEAAEQSAQKKTAQQLVELFAADGMILHEDSVSGEAPPMPLHLARDTIREREMAAFFLGESLKQEDQGGGIYSYTAQHGVALFREDGSFDVAGTLAETDAEEVCREFCEKFSYDELTLTLDDHGNGSATAVCLHEKLPIFNGTVTFKFERGKLQTVSGTMLPESGTVTTAEKELVSAPAALIAFQNMRRETGAVVSAVTDVYPCYRLQSSPAVPMSLVPAWCIVTDTSEYYVNCITAAVSIG